MGEYQPRSPCCREAHPDDTERLCDSCKDYRSFRLYVMDQGPPYRPPPGFVHTPYWQAKGLPRPDYEKKKRKGKEDTDGGHTRSWEDVS